MWQIHYHPCFTDTSCEVFRESGHGTNVIWILKQSSLGSLSITSLQEIWHVYSYSTTEANAKCTSRCTLAEWLDLLQLARDFWIFRELTLSLSYLADDKAKHLINLVPFKMYKEIVPQRHKVFVTNYLASSWLASPMHSLTQSWKTNRRYLQQEATNTYKRVSYRERYRQRTRKDHYRKLSRKIKVWMLIISFSVSIGFSGCRGGSQVAFLLCLWFPSETIIALGKCIHVKNNFFPCLSL